jgi:two-component system cell cycle response regulator DivK
MSDEKKKRILVIEDNPDNRTLIIDVLDSLDYVGLEAVNGEEGVEIAARERPDVVLLDLSLPRKDGWTAVGELKADPDLAHIPVIAMTAHAMVGDRERALKAGCDDYISKPIDLTLLVEKLRKYLEKRE